MSKAVPTRSPRKPKKKLEKDIQREICEWLQSRGYFFWRQNNMPVWDKNRFRAMPKFTPKGLPDIIIIHDRMTIGLEVKVPGYWKRTDSQIIMKDNFINNGAYYSIVTSLEEAQGYLQAIYA